jgi:hypothetical protein
LFWASNVHSSNPTLLIAIVALSTVASCAQVPNLTPRVILPGESPGASFWLRAPEIVVVKVASADLVGPEIEITSPQRLVVRLATIKGTVENVLRGDRPVDRPIIFYFFTNIPSSNGFTTPKYWLDVDSRYIVFLREDNGVLRTMADVAPPEILILTGRHSQADLTREDPARAILQLALSPSSDYEPTFGSNLQHTELSIQEFVKPSDLARYLRMLLSHPDMTVQTEACLVLSRRFRYRDPCLPRLLESTDQRVRAQARMWMREGTGTTNALITALRENPWSLSLSGNVEDLASDLAIFIWDSDRQVRHEACMTIRRLFPASEPTGCAEDQ